METSLFMQKITRTGLFSASSRAIGDE